MRAACEASHEWKEAACRRMGGCAYGMGGVTMWGSHLWVFVVWDGTGRRSDWLVHGLRARR